jgi:hypothetical protein
MEEVLFGKGGDILAASHFFHSPFTTDKRAGDYAALP